jgi:hypothetical protein
MHVATVDTSQVANRRPIRFQTIEDLSAEVDRLTAAVRLGKVRPLGNWSPAKVLWHIARLVELSFDGFPFRYRRAPAWITRLLHFIAWRWMIAHAFRPGFKNPTDASVLEPDAAVSFDAAAAYLKSSSHASVTTNG